MTSSILEVIWFCKVKYRTVFQSSCKEVLLLHGNDTASSAFEHKEEEYKMAKSTVYFTDFRCPVGTSQLDKLRKLCIAAGIKDIDMDGKFVAIKMHFGELGNMAFLHLVGKLKRYSQEYHFPRNLGFPRFFSFCSHIK